MYAAAITWDWSAWLITFTSVLAALVIAKQVP